MTVAPSHTTECKPMTDLCIFLNEGQATGLQITDDLEPFATSFLNKKEEP